MVDNVLSWAILLVAGYYFAYQAMKKASNKQGVKRKTNPEITKVYRYF